ncbi:VWA domain-containing protein [Paracoccus sp. (in: a-proteobacteria)]|uniref:VWA domain-containing protein n=1 Tax=Paracoccus sp. TaxID=267 RepID=UPI00396CA833
MSFAAPWLLALLFLPLLMRWLAPHAAPPGPALRLPAYLAAGLHEAGAARRRKPLLPILAWMLLVLALAGPQVRRVADVVPASGRDIVLTLDLSGSMVQEDFFLDNQPATRLEAVKRTASRFVAARQGDRIGLVIFGEQAYVAAPLTFDMTAVARAIDEAQVGISGRGTAIADGLGLAMRRLADSEAPSRVIVLLSDGVDTSGTVLATEVARLAAGRGMRIHTIALGPEDLESRPDARDAVDVATLRAIAQTAGGETFRVRDADDLAQMAATLDQLEPNPGKAPPLRYWQGLWTWPAAAALAVLMLQGLRGRRWAA